MFTKERPRCPDPSWRTPLGISGAESEDEEDEFEAGLGGIGGVFLLA